MRCVILFARRTKTAIVVRVGAEWVQLNRAAGRRMCLDGGAASLPSAPISCRFARKIFGRRRPLSDRHLLLRDVFFTPLSQTLHRFYRRSAMGPIEFDVSSRPWPCLYCAQVSRK